MHFKSVVPQGQLFRLCGNPCGNRRRCVRVGCPGACYGESLCRLLQETCEETTTSECVCFTAMFDCVGEPPQRRGTANRTGACRRFGSPLLALPNSCYPLAIRPEDHFGGRHAGL